MIREETKRFIKELLTKLAAFTAITYIINQYVVKNLILLMVQIALRTTGIQIAFNMSIVDFIFTLEGAICSICILVVLTLVLYYEYSVTILLIHNYRMKQIHSLKDTMKYALSTFSSLKGFSIIGFIAYIFLLLPLSGLGLTSILTRNILIPNFVIGEVGKFSWGYLVLSLFYMVVILLFFASIFVLPVMVLEGKNFFQAIKFNFKKIKSSLRNMIVLFGMYLIIWLVLYYFPKYVFLQLFDSPTISIGLLFEKFRFSWQFFLLLPTIILYFCIEAILMPLLMIVVVFYYPITEEGKQRVEQLYLESTFDINYLKERPVIRKIYQWRATNKKFRTISTVLALGFIIYLGSDTFKILRIPSALQEPIVIGHRGSFNGVENTLQAIQGAIDAGADYAEIDILLSKDGIPMVIHDTNLSRLAGVDVNVYELTAEELKKISLYQNGHTGNISILEEVIQYCDGKIKLVIELKTHGKEEKNLIDEIMQVVDQYQFRDSIMFLSMDYELIEEANTKYYEIDAGFCIFGEIGILDPNIIRTMNIDFVFIEEAMVSAETLYRFRSSWLPVYVWTANEPQAMKQYLEVGISGIVTDDPLVARVLVDKFMEYTKIDFLDDYDWGE